MVIEKWMNDEPYTFLASDTDDPNLDSLKSTQFISIRILVTNFSADR